MYDTIWSRVFILETEKKEVYELLGVQTEFIEIISRVEMEIGESVITFSELDLKMLAKKVKEFFENNHNLSTDAKLDAFIAEFVDSGGEGNRQGNPYLGILAIKLFSGEGYSFDEITVDEFCTELERKQEEIVSFINELLDPRKIKGLTTAELFMLKMNGFSRILTSNNPSVCAENVWKNAHKGDRIAPLSTVPADNNLKATIARTICPSSIEEIIAFLSNEYLMRRIKIKPCKHCGRYFLTSYLGTEYCDRPAPGAAAPCRVVGPVRVYQRKQEQNPIVREYRRSYRAHNARIKYGSMSPDAFRDWVEEAQKMREACKRGEISLEEFVQWLDRDKQK